MLHAAGAAGFTKPAGAECVFCFRNAGRITPPLEVGMNLIANFAVLASRRTIFDVPVCDLGWDDALVFINELASLTVGQTVIAFANAHNTLMTLRDSEYRNILLQNLVLPDGIGLNIASKIAHGASFPANLNGTDFVPALLTFMENPRRVGLIGGRRAVVDRAAAKFRHHAPWHEFVIISDGYFDKENPVDLIDELNRQKCDILIIGMGTPLQEKWAHHHVRADHARLVLTVGALFDFVFGCRPPCSADRSRDAAGMGLPPAAGAAPALAPLCARHSGLPALRNAVPLQPPRAHPEPVGGARPCTACSAEAERLGRLKLLLLRQVNHFFAVNI